MFFVFFRGYKSGLWYSLVFKVKKKKKDMMGCDGKELVFFKG